MKKVVAALILILVQFHGFSTAPGDAIKITDDIELIKISENAYIHVSYSIMPKWGRVGANGLILINGQQAWLFDSPWTNAQTEKLLSYMTNSMHLEVIGFVPNHWHVDCMGGLEFILKQGINTYANQLTIDIAKANKLPLPEYAFNDSLVLELGDIRIECYYLGAAHSMDNIVVWIPSEQILFPACMVKSVESRNLGNTADGDLVAYPKTLDKLLKKFPSARIVIPGHGNYGGLELIQHTLELASD
ncbi:MAG: subclass B1 metallo-beta-lactamase [Prolixibacteraceae bacterium]